MTARERIHKSQNYAAAVHYPHGKHFANGEQYKKNTASEEKHKFGVLQIKHKSTIRPQSSSQNSYCGGGGSHSKCSKSARSRSPEQRVNELGLAIFEFVKKKEQLPVAQTAAVVVKKQKKAIDM